MQTTDLPVTSIEKKNKLLQIVELSIVDQAA